MQKLNITKCVATDKKKDGTPIVNKYGKTVWRVGILTDKYGEEWINGFLPFEPKWEGTEQELEIYEEEFNGQIQKKFNLPKQEDKLMSDIKEIKQMLYQILDNTAVRTDNIND